MEKKKLAVKQLAKRLVLFNKKCNWYQFLSLQMSLQVSCTYVLIPPQCTHFIRVRVFNSNT